MLYYSSGSTSLSRILADSISKVVENKECQPDSSTGIEGAIF